MLKAVHSLSSDIIADELELVVVVANDVVVYYGTSTTITTTTTTPTTTSSSSSSSLLVGGASVLGYYMKVGKVSNIVSSNNMLQHTR